ncbi:LysR family transcriptional regulator [Robbsia sp. Bb-Pol-6]|uniref:LysR family transcriptional regulator n=1 Tax=Robbsia betulipollinis TaxID=2981849 RepID=A0ABT3ZU66_9BURK|nr:LysR family transcriptional regulator [Robbsia betulipollinis]MCY0389450.1 LysR family transcriptional regulator [Robbsia betulipollinis]
MELRHLRYFLAVAQEASFTRAAARLGLGQPPLSQQIKQLEQELGVRLFRRTSHGVVLSDAGRAFEPEAQRVLDDTQRAMRAAQRAGRGETGILRVGFTGSAAFNAVVPDSIRRFRTAFPKVELTLEEATTSHLLQSLQENRLDAAFIRPGAALTAGLDLHRFPDEAMKIVVASDHPLAGRTGAALVELTHEPFVLFPREIGLSIRETVLEACIAAGFTPRLGQEAPQISSVINLVAAALGVSIVPAAIAKVQVDGVRYLDIIGDAPRARLAVATRVGGAEATVANFLHLLG